MYTSAKTAAANRDIALSEIVDSGELTLSHPGHTVHLHANPHPWRELGLLKRLVLHWQELRPGMWGATDGQRLWLDPRQLQVERRCTLAHELEHIRRGHGSCLEARAEASVRHAAAVYLAPDPDAVADALVLAQGDLWQAADHALAGSSDDARAARPATHAPSGEGDHQPTGCS